MNARLKNAGRWIAIADRDLAAAVMLVGCAPDIAAFHLQQATEKYLKAFLTLHGQASENRMTYRPCCSDVLWWTDPLRRWQA